MADYKVKIGADSSAFKAALQNINADVEKAGSKFKQKLFGAIAGTAAVAGLTTLVKKSVEAGTAIARGSKRLQMTSDEYQRLSAMASRAGTSVESTAPAFRQMNRMLYEASQGSESANQTLTDLGLSLEDLRNADAIDKFEMVAKALSKVGNEGDKATLATRIWGRSGTELIPLLNNFEGLKNVVDDTLTLMDKDAVAAAEKFTNEIEMLRSNMQAAFVNSGLLKYLGDIAGSMNDIITAAKMIDKGADSTTPGVKGPGAGGMAAEGFAHKTTEYLSDIAGGIIGAIQVGASYAIDGITHTADSMAGFDREAAQRETERLYEMGTGKKAPKDMGKRSKSDIFYAPGKDLGEMTDTGLERVFRRANPIGASKTTPEEIAEGRKRMEAERKSKKSQEQRTKAADKSKHIADLSGIEAELDIDYYADIAEKKKIADEAALKESRYQGLLEELTHQTKQQLLINDELNKQAAIEDAIYQAQKRNADLTKEQLDAVGTLAGTLYDLQNTKLPEADLDMIDTDDYGRDATSLERMGAMLGPRAMSDAGQMLQRKIESTMQQQLKTLNAINKQNRLAELGYI